MRRPLVAVVVRALLATSALGPVAYAQTPPTVGPVDTRNFGSIPFTATGGNTARTTASRAADVVNVKDFGAFCDNNTDDAAAFNAAFTFARNLTNDPGGHQAVRIVIPYGSCMIKSTINATGFTGSYEVFVDGAGSILKGETNGTPVIDALSSRFIHFQNMTIFGMNTLTPNIGLQIGRITSGIPADDFAFDNVTINGAYTFASLYNFASETGHFNHLTLGNTYASGSCFGLVQDGQNHWNATSSFVTETIPADTAQSFNEDTFINPVVQVTSPCVPFWMGGTSRHRYIGGYSSTNGVNAVDLWSGTGLNPNYMLDMDVHFETTSITDTFLVTGTNTTPSLLGFAYREHQSQASNSLFKLDTGITSATINNAKIEVGAFASGNSVKLFDDASKWTGSGNVVLPNILNWPTPPGGAWSICAGSSCWPYVPETPLNRNPDFVIDQIGEGAARTLNSTIATGATMIDGWLGLSNNLGSPRFSTQRVTTSPPPGYGNSLTVATVNTITPSSTQFNYIESEIYVRDGLLNYGTATAIPIMVDVLLKANNTGSYALALSNASNTRSYVHDCVITSANTWTSCRFIVPGDTSGTWTAVNGNVVLILYLNVGSGSNFQTTGGSWQAGQFVSTSASTNLTTLSGGTIGLAAVHVYPGVQLLPYLPRQYDLEQKLANNFYRKTFPIGTAVAQSAGVAGALCARNPIAAGEPSTFWKWDAPMAGVPTITTYNPSAANANWRDVTAGADVSVSVDPTTSISGSTGVEIAASATVTNIGDDLCIHATADTKK